METIPLGLSSAPCSPVQLTLKDPHMHRLTRKKDGNAAISSLTILDLPMETIPLVLSSAPCSPIQSILTILDLPMKRPNPNPYPNPNPDPNPK